MLSDQKGRYFDSVCTDARCRVMENLGPGYRLAADLSNNKRRRNWGDYIVLYSLGLTVIRRRNGSFPTVSHCHLSADIFE